MIQKIITKFPFLNNQYTRFIFFLIKNFLKDKCQQKAASLTYTTMLSIVPIFTVIVVMLSTIPVFESVREQIYSLIYNNLLPNSNLNISKYISTFAEKSSNLTAIGVLVLFFTTIMTLVTIESAFNQIWRVQEKSRFLKSLLRYWTLLTLGPLVLGTAFIMSGAIRSISFLNQNVMGYGISWVFWMQIVSILISIASFLGMYWFIPKANVPIKNAAIAAIITALLFESLKRAFGNIMSNFTSYEAVYGAFAALPIFLLWIYLSWNLILLGVEISYCLTVFSKEVNKKRSSFMTILCMLHVLYQNHQDGQATSEKQLRDVLSNHELTKWYIYINDLIKNDLIAKTEDNEYILKHDLEKVSVWQIYKKLPYSLPIKHRLSQSEFFVDDLNNPHDNIMHLFEDAQKDIKNKLNVNVKTLFDK